mmetsp:Transcript_2663/g.5488  ORF Transcript_2663/g.5488 Transcript_2663/m.5488 type:complete len:91 (-) Transcript_2663:851-1123(-)
MPTRLHPSILLIASFSMINNVSLALQTTTIPPLIDVPTFSLSTLGPKKNDNLTSQLNSKDVSAKKKHHEHFNLRLTHQHQTPQNVVRQFV